MSQINGDTITLTVPKLDEEQDNLAGCTTITYEIYDGAGNPIVDWTMQADDLSG